ncbi:MAG: ABC transporter substrate-binding protein [Prevotellaceae bacterium]|jgi:branched-chain amino acid transport system substrate-binding protein|nr:ABC transporter substrate-binding protein [Prevotellaceae bacterium]
MNKKILVGVTAAALVAVMVWVFFAKNNEGGNETEKVKIGVSVPLTGNLAFWGEEVKRGMEIYAANQEVSDKLTLLFEDNKGLPNEAVTSMKKLIEFNKAQAIVTMLVKLSAPQREIAEQKQIPLVSTYNSSSGFTKGYTFTYQDFATHEWQLPALTHFVFNELKATKGITFCSSDDFGKDGQKFFKLNLEKLGGTILDTVLFAPGTIDLRNDIAKIMQKKPEFIFVVGQENELIVATKQIRERDRDILIFGIGSFESPTVWGAIPAEYQNNLYFVNSFFDKDFDDESTIYFNDYVAKCNQEPSMPSVYGYSICKYLYAILSEVQKTNTSFAAVTDTIQIRSIRGNLQFNDLHEIMSDFGLYKRENNKSILISKYKSAYYE